MKKNRIFYGWYILAAGLPSQVFHGVTIIYGFTAFIDPLARTFGWSYTQISLAISLIAIESSILHPLAGVLVDRYSSRRLAFIGIATYGLALLLLSQARNLAIFYLGYMILGLGSSIGVMITPETIIARWFRKNIGKVSGAWNIGIGMGGVLVALLVKIIDSYGLQTTYIILATGMLVICLPLCFAYRTRPEDCGMLPDGEKSDADQATKAVPYGPRAGVEFREALRTRTFWLLGIGTLFQVAATNAVMIYLLPYLTSVGIDRSFGSMIITGYTLISICLRFPLGWLADIYDKRYMMAIYMAMVGVSLVLLRLTDSHAPVLLTLFVILFAVGLGGLVSTRLPIYREYFGSRDFGKIFGLGMVFLTVSQVLTPIMTGLVFDNLHDFTPIWLILSGATVIALIATLAVPSPPGKRRYAAASRNP